MIRLIGKTILEIRGYTSDARKKHISPEFILFSDGETYLILEEQDTYTYHDCDYKARIPEIIVSKERWQGIFNDRKHYPQVKASYIGLS